MEITKKITITNAFIPPESIAYSEFVFDVMRILPDDLFDAIDDADVISSFIRHESTCKVLGICTASSTDFYVPRVGDDYYVVRLGSGNAPRGKDVAVDLDSLEIYHVIVREK